MATVQAFDAADWLARFIAADGWYMVKPNKIHTGWRVDGKEDEAREIWREIDKDETKRAAVRREMRETTVRYALPVGEG